MTDREGLFCWTGSQDQEACQLQAQPQARGTGPRPPSGGMGREEVWRTQKTGQRPLQRQQRDLDLNRSITFVWSPRELITVPQRGAGLSPLWKSGKPSPREIRRRRSMPYYSQSRTPLSHVLTVLILLSSLPSFPPSAPCFSSLIPSSSHLLPPFPSFSPSSVLTSPPSPCAASQMAATSPKGRRPALTLSLA